MQEIQLSLSNNYRGQNTSPTNVEKGGQCREP